MAIADYAQNIGSNIMGGANWLADRASNIFLNQVPNRYLDYKTGRTDPVTDIREIAPTRSTQDILTQGIASNIERKGHDFSSPFSSVVQATGGGGEHGLGRTVDYGGYKLGNPLEAGITGVAGELGAYWNLLGGSPENQIANTLGDYTVNYTPKLDPNHPELMSIQDIYDFAGKAGEGTGSPYDINVNLSPQMIEKIKNYYQNEDEEGILAFDPNNPQVKRAGFFDFNPWTYAASKGFQYVLKKKREKEKFIKDLEKFQKKEQEENRIKYEKQEAEKRQAQLQAQITQQAYQEAERRVAGGEGRDYGHTETRASSGWASSPMNQGGLIEPISIPPSNRGYHSGGRVRFSEGGIVGLWRELSSL